MLCYKVGTYVVFIHIFFFFSWKEGRTKYHQRQSIFLILLHGFKRMNVSAQCGTPETVANKMTLPPSSADCYRFYFWY